MKRFLAALISALMLAAVGMTSLSSAEQGLGNDRVSSGELGAARNPAKQTQKAKKTKKAKKTNKAKQSVRAKKRVRRTSRSKGLSAEQSYADMLVNKSSYELGDRDLKSGAQGTDVMELQELLNRLGLNVGRYGVDKDGVDGKYGAKTVAAVKLLQKYLGLKATGRYTTETHETFKAFLEKEGFDYDAEKENLRNDLLASLGLKRIDKAESDDAA